MKNKIIKCPHCNEEITCLNFNITATCGGVMEQEEVLNNEPTEYDLSCLTDNVQYDDFSCPECNEVIEFGEEGAINFLRSK